MEPNLIKCYYLLSLYFMPGLFQNLNSPPLNKKIGFHNNGTATLLARYRETGGSIGLDALVTEVTVKMVQKQTCLGIITDQAHQDVFNTAFFRKLGDTPYLKVLVKDNEDLLSPNYGTLEVIRQIRKDGCHSYVILLSNGAQMARLLRFGDRYRVLKTRANFLLLYDFRLFTVKLHYLWKKIVNVVFLHHYGGRRPGRRNPTHWYELTTVPFPNPIHDIFVLRRLDTWRQGKFRSSADLFREKTADLRGQMLRVVTFQHLPAAVKMLAPPLRIDRGVEGNGPIGFGGMEIEVLITLAEAMSFSPRVYEAANPDVELWGSKQLNGTFSGLIGEVVSGSADVALGNLHYTQYHLDLMDLTKPYITECLTFLTPESLTDNSWMTLILPFKVYMWITVILTLFVGGFVFYALARFQKYLNSPHSKLMKPEKNILVKKLLVKDVREHRNVIQEQKVHTESESDLNAKEESGLEGLYLFGDLRNGILYTYSMLLLVSLPKLPTGWSIRVLTGWWWMYCILVVTAYRASMTAILANPAPRVTIDTLDQLATNPISCGGWGEQNKDFFLTSLDTAGRKIGEKFEVIHDTNSALDKVSKGTFAFYDNIYFLQYASVKKQLLTEQNKNSEDTVLNTDQSDSVDRNLHIMRDCAINMPISIGLRKNSPLKLQMDKFILRMIEAGLIKKWLNDVMLVTFSAEIPDQGKSTKALMDLRKLYGAFVALGLGYFLSISMLIVERIYWKYVVTKNPHFDKYNRKIFYANKI